MAEDIINDGRAKISFNNINIRHRFFDIRTHLSTVLPHPAAHISSGVARHLI